jgi:2-polyprenyl-3-methyl-5-hydroxy-6-metoxy-1,4-benzoquinol methylase
MKKTFAVAAVAALGVAAAAAYWKSGQPTRWTPSPSDQPPPPAALEPAAPDPTLEQDREEYIAAVIAYTGETREVVLGKMKQGAQLMKDEWTAWEKKGPMTPERTKAFYKETGNYIYDLGQWHLYDLAVKRPRDLALVESVKKLGFVRTILDFGCGVGFNSVLLAKAGFKVTVADVDGKSLDLAVLRMKRLGLPHEVWKTDVDPMPPEKTYDLIAALDVLEHLPVEELRSVVPKLISVKTERTKMVMHATFGFEDQYPMHEAKTKEADLLIERLSKEVPKR